MTTIPFLDLKAQHTPLRDEIRAAIDEVIDANAFAGGSFVAQFERDFAAYCDCTHAIGVGNGTDALWLALLALGVGPGDEVITVPSTFMATAEAITYCGAKPTFVDVDPLTYTMDPSRLEAAITPRTKAIIPVHLFGQVADMDPIMEIARRHHLPVVEDACQAHGAEYKGRKAGSIGDVGCFSFYPGKNLGAMGEAGGIVTNNQELNDKVRILRDHGQSEKYHHVMVGWNCRMDGIQGAVLRIKLKHLEKGNDLRRAHAAAYTEALSNLDGIVTPTVAEDRKHVFHVYALLVEERDEMIRKLGKAGVATGIHYPVPIHLQKAYQSLGHAPGDFPVSERSAEKFLSLPMYPELTVAQRDRVIEAVSESALVTA